ncbi:MAG TPA: hypothetical protein PKL83_05060, partial [bacterium]|nr:hypothetical protein [bacterium]
SIGNTLFIGLHSISSAGVLQLQPNAEGAIELEAGKVIISTEGDITAAGDIKANDLTVNTISASNDSRGRLVIKPGETEIAAIASWPTAPMTVQITPTWETNFWITDITDSGFIIHFSTPPEAESDIHWLAIW